MSALSKYAHIKKSTFCERLTPQKKNPLNISLELPN